MTSVLNNLKKKQMIAAICIALIIIAVGLVSYRAYYIQTSVPEKNGLDVVYHVDSISLENQVLSIEGWCFKIWETPYRKGPQIILIQTDDYSHIYYFRGGHGIARPEVNAYYHDGVDYTNCGFRITADLSQLDPEKDYEILLQADNSRSTRVEPGLYLHEGTIMRADPADFLEPEVENTDLEPIIAHSELKYYNREYGIYIYQDGWDLYYIADDYYDFGAGWNRIGHNVYTTCPLELPENRVQYGYASLDWTFEYLEITAFINTGKYRAAWVRIPESYPVSVINTGAWVPNGDWIWNVRICPGILQSQS